MRSRGSTRVLPLARRLTPPSPSLRRYFDEISQDTGKFCFGVEDTLQCLDMGAVETLIVWENLEINRHVLMNTATSETMIKYLTLEQEKDTSHFVDKDTGVHRALLGTPPVTGTDSVNGARQAWSWRRRRRSRCWNGLRTSTSASAASSSALLSPMLLPCPLALTLA